MQSAKDSYSDLSKGFAAIVGTSLLAGLGWFFWPSVKEGRRIPVSLVRILHAFLIFACSIPAVRYVAKQTGAYWAPIHHEMKIAEQQEEKANDLEQQVELKQQLIENNSIEANKQVDHWKSAYETALLKADDLQNRLKLVPNDWIGTEHRYEDLLHVREQERDDANAKLGALQIEYQSLQSKTNQQNQSPRNHGAHYGDWQQQGNFQSLSVYCDSDGTEIGSIFTYESIYGPVHTSWGKNFEGADAAGIYMKDHNACR